MFVSRSWVRWLLAAGGVILTFWMCLPLGLWLPLGVPEDEAVRWSVATTLASVVSAVVGVPLVRWAEGRHPLSKES